MHLLSDSLSITLLTAGGRLFHHGYGDRKHHTDFKINEEYEQKSARKTSTFNETPQQSSRDGMCDKAHYKRFPAIILQHIFADLNSKLCWP